MSRFSSATIKKMTNFNSHTDLELVANADEAEFARLLFGVLGGVGVLKQLSNKFVF